MNCPVVGCMVCTSQWMVLGEWYEWSGVLHYIVALKSTFPITPLELN